MFPLKIQICFISLYNQTIKRNNQIFKITMVWIPPRWADVDSKLNNRILYLAQN